MKRLDVTAGFVMIAGCVLPPRPSDYSLVAFAAAAGNTGKQGVSGHPQTNGSVKGSPKANPSISGSQTRGKH
jgi:hypothetical protein